MSSIIDTQAYKRGRVLKTQIDALKRQNAPSWQEQAIRLIRSSRFDDLKLEFGRLIGAGAIDFLSLEEIERVLPPPTTGLLDKEHLQTRCILGQALEIKQIYQDTHYVLTHGQSRRGYLLSLIYKKEAKLAGKNLKYFKYLRPHTILATPIPLTNYTMNSVCDYYSEIKKDLLSCSTNPFCNFGGESALSFFSSNISFSYFGQLALDHTGQKVDPPPNPDNKPGNLFVICIPKYNFTQMGYLSHSGGTPCKCSKKEIHRILREAQKGYKMSECENEWGSQARLSLSNLTPDCRIFALTPFTKMERKAMKNTVDQLPIRSKL